MTKNPYLQITPIQDLYTRKNFEALDDYFQAQNQLLDFKSFELVFTGAVSGFKQVHGLNAAPLDILVMHLTGPGAVTFKYGSFDTTYLVMDVSGACRIRFLAGTCPKISSSVQTVASDSQKFSSGV